ncbi:hypothetical protein PTTG_27371 [Puccinia triticina 1-1 BBBD Race 1]|uniref:Uncharacterized protein n=1 Tax=Puccinia triticina (isolate 1-1 / race 1 (BBBD)) TaxID=630390 RepID=A0A180GN37_PUCT1|nr:hypothetical protein PTTG_27371 [Puccinia triticina 1-1 BBBD Race 1]
MTKAFIISTASSAQTGPLLPPGPCDLNPDAAQRIFQRKLRKVTRTKPAVENVPTNVSSQIRLKEIPGPQSLIERISVSAKDRTVKSNQTDHSNTAQRAG